MKDNFKQRVFDIVAKIPKGSIMTYKSVATKAGNPRSARAVGMILSHNTDKKIPCHRVIHSDGSLGGYNHLRGKSKRSLLESEGAINTQ